MDLYKKMQKDNILLAKRASKLNDLHFGEFNLLRDSILKDSLHFETLPEPLKNISYDCEYCIIDDDNDETGSYEDNVIYIHYKYKNDKSTLLHEMLHYHIDRYEKLKEKIWIRLIILLK